MGYVKKNNKTKSDLWLTIVCIVLVVVVVASILTAALNNAGVFLRISDAVATENYEVNGAMMSYFFNEELSSWISNNATSLQYAALYPSYFGDYNVNFSADLDSQVCKIIPEAERTEDYKTWYDYFIKLTVDTVTRYLEYSEGAKAAGVELNDEDKNNVKETLSNLMADLKANGYKLEDVYGNGITKNDVKKCLELKELAVKYAEIKIEELKGVLEADDKDVFAYPDLEEHKSEFYSAKYISYTIQKNEKDFKTDAEYESAKAEAKAAADLIAKSETPELFFEAIMKYEEESKKAAAETATESETTSSSTTAATTEAPEMEDYTKEVYYNTGTAELDKWLFEENAEDGASKVIEQTETTTTKASTTTAAEETTTTEETTRTTNEVYKVTAYKVIKSNDINRDKTFDLGYVVTTDKALAERILKDFNNGGTLTGEALKKLGEAEAAKLGENSDIGIDANTQENAMPEYFKGFSDDLDKWLNSKDLKKGTNSGIIEVKPTQDGQKTQYVICHFDDHGDEVWYAEAFDLVMEERFEAWFEDMKSKKPIEQKDNTLTKMTVSVYVQNMASQITSSSSSMLG